MYFCIAVKFSYCSQVQISNKQVIKKFTAPDIEVILE